jgi:CheY-like chemotaxis protein
MTKTILLADDSVTIRKVVELTFSETGIRVESVGSGREALERFEALGPDLVLADVAMPGPSGYEVCEHVKASDRPVPVLLLAGTFEPFDTDRARACGADGHVVKPFESSALVERVESLLAAPIKPPVRPAAATSPIEPPVESADRHLDSALQSLGSSAAAEVPGVAASPNEAPLPESEVPEDAAVAVEAETLPVPEVAAPAAGGARLSAAELDALAAAVVERLSTDVLRQIAWEVVPDLAEAIIRERIRDLEREIEG